MAKKATIYKVNLQIADMDRSYYSDHSLTVARHPSETDERMMVRLLAFALNAHEDMQFTKGLCVDDEPDIWQKNLSDEIEVWIDVGQPDEKRIKKACSRSRRVCLYTYSGASAQIWWEKIADKLKRFENLAVINFPPIAARSLAELAQRSMELQCTIQEGQVWFGDAAMSVEIVPEYKTIF